MNGIKKVTVLGLDGLEPRIVDRLMCQGRLPHLARLREQGGYSRVATTYPAQTPVAWSSFTTGTNPGGHGIFDFLRRNLQTNLPDLSLFRYEQKNQFVPPKAVNLRRGTPFWKIISDAGLDSTVLRCPCTYPPDNIRGRMLSGMGVPDLRGTFSTPTFYTTDATAKAGESENVVHLSRTEGVIRTHLIGPRNSKTKAFSETPFTLHRNSDGHGVIIQSKGQPQQLRVQERQWSDWLQVNFKMGLFQSVSGMVRFYLARLEPHIELYASPINYDAAAPPFPISSPPEYAAQLREQVGKFYTTGMVEDHGGLDNERFDEAAYLDQCEQVMRERERMMLHELSQFDEGFFYCLFDTPDRVQHMFWRFHESEHPANRRGTLAGMEKVIDDCYCRCDDAVGKALASADDQSLFIVLSDHGFNSFQRGVHLNSWLHEMGLLKMKNGCQPGPEAESFFQGVDWSQTKAYALGLSSIYLNIKGREENGIVANGEAESLKQNIAEKLTGLQDPERGKTAVRSVVTREQVYSGPYAGESPDLVVNFAEQYRVSWSTALGGIPPGLFEDNQKKWSGDHIIDPDLVPGVLFMNRPFQQDNARLVDLAPTILEALKLAPTPEMEGRSLLL